MEKNKKLLATIKSLNWNLASVSFYVVKRQLVHRKATYDVLQVNADDELRKKLRGITSGKIQQSNAALEYDFNTADLDDNLLGIATSETDFQSIINTITAEEEPELADSIEKLIDSWLYIARLDLAGKPPLYAARRISEGWTTKKVSQLISMIFQNNMLVDIEQKEIFRIDGKIDFFSYDDTTFIADKKNFETALNFREGMERNRDEIVEELHALDLFDNASEISTLVGNNIRRLRRLSQVKKAGYYKDANFLANLKKVNDEENWGIKYSADGKLLVTEEDIETVLRVLNNDRLTSKINSENFDVDVKHKLGSAI
ncbi:hypothetical protein SCT_0387 [Sulfuricella sp. T08]|uniref:Kiwa anti-phage protein KwaB-like domain-containing protein n=1 Tax=Sulfuricella sp. T08 TaxID=1632857 RepID=UPI00061799D6|nr:Kiwa anti-phage protein KwaB-like domain-containing protein [Sulfuricella sp. T08]GAO35007.1 hypothetical protein SCT_0387 [Sulfuricella sp. T08]